MGKFSPLQRSQRAVRPVPASSYPALLAPTRSSAIQRQAVSAGTSGHASSLAPLENTARMGGSIKNIPMTREGFSAEQRDAITPAWARTVAPAPAHASGPSGHTANTTGLPETLQANAESLANMPLDDVRVHYNSPQPDKIQALAYTRGTNIYVGPGQEKHLPHEVWHVVQQKRRPVKPTLLAKGLLPLNNDQDLEAEADRMGAKMMQMDAEGARRPEGLSATYRAQLAPSLHAAQRDLSLYPAQRKLKALSSSPGQKGPSAVNYQLPDNPGTATFLEGALELYTKGNFKGKTVKEIEGILYDRYSSFGSKANFADTSGGFKSKVEQQVFTGKSFQFSKEKES